MAASTPELYSGLGRAPGGGAPGSCRLYFFAGRRNPAPKLMRPLSVTLGSRRGDWFATGAASGRGSSSLSVAKDVFETVAEEIIELSFTVNKHCIANHHFTRQSKTHDPVITLSTS